MVQPFGNPLVLFACAVSTLFVGAAFLYMATKSPYYWGGLFVPGVVLLLVFAGATILTVMNLLARL